jgi:hypothetical protein
MICSKNRGSGTISDIGVGDHNLAKEMSVIAQDNQVNDKESQLLLTENLPKGL